MLVLFLIASYPLLAQEKIFAGYFDIQTGSSQNTQVTGRIHLERNKDVHKTPVPESYYFKILQNADNNLFRIETQYDLSKRIMGVIYVNDNRKISSLPLDYKLTVALMDNQKIINQFDVKIHATDKPLWNILYDRYTSGLTENSRMYGRMKYSDQEVSKLIDELNQNNGRFHNEKCYTAVPQDYMKGNNRNVSSREGGTIEYDWARITEKIGGLGYAYATSSVFGPDGVPEKRAALGEAIKKALIAYMRSVPVYGHEVLVDGKPVGDCIGDGFAMLHTYKLSGNQIPTHQWTLTDPLIVPVVQLMPDILKGMANGDSSSSRLHDELIRYFQLFFAEVNKRRRIDDPSERWGELQDTCYSSGAWADANLGHRSRTLLALPLIWGDYNRPVTYVDYWYSDFYKTPPFKDFSFSPGWTPHGVVSDIQYWMTKYRVPAHRYIQSGFQPDGTVSHHIGHATDAAMVAYGFEWLTDCSEGYKYLKGTAFEVPAEYPQFQLDRLLKVYPKLFYKQRMDLLVAGRSFNGDMQKFVLKTYIGAVNNLLNTRSNLSELSGVSDLIKVKEQILKGRYEYSGTDAYWVNEYLVHRRGENEKPFFCSLKLKSERTVGAEDFDRKVRRSWNMGYGILLLRIKGDEYANLALDNFDWHALPGLTEEWRTEPFPLKGGAQASLPGKNKIAGVMADGRFGMGIYHHAPGEKYSCANAFKSYHFVNDKIVAQGSGISRERKGESGEIVTFVDQSLLNGELTWCINNKTSMLTPEQSVNISEPVTEVCWAHHADKGYVFIPDRKLQLRIQTGTEINVTAGTKKGNKNNGFILALSHGAEPGRDLDNSYAYVLLPGVTAKEMPAAVKSLMKDIGLKREEASAHAFYSAVDKVWQFAFFKPGTASVGKIAVTSDDTAQIMLRENPESWNLIVSNPAPDGLKRTLSFFVSQKLREGIYSYQLKGVCPMPGETIKITQEGKGSRIIVELPDLTDAKKYNYQSDLYSGSPLEIEIPK